MKQRVVLKGIQSSWKAVLCGVPRGSVLCGVPQGSVLSGVPWGSVLSGVPWGSVLGVIFLVIFINDIDVNIISTLSKFADDCKAACAVHCTERAFKLQEDITKLYWWSKDWQMLFHPAKCKCLHVGYNNLGCDYFLGDNRIQTVTQEKDLGVTVQYDLSPGAHIGEIVKKANRNLGMIRRACAFKSQHNIMNLYKTGETTPRLCISSVVTSTDQKQS